MKRLWLLSSFLPLIANLYGGEILRCEQMNQSKETIFASDFKGDAEIEFNCFNIPNLNELLNASVKIRGESRACVGNLADRNLSAFKFIVAKALFVPQIYAKDLPLGDEYEKNIEIDRAKLRKFASESLDNFLLFKEFNKNYNDVLKPLVTYFQELNLDEASAIYYATKLSNEFLKFAVLNKESSDVSEFEKRVGDPQFTKFSVGEFVYSGGVSGSSIQSAFNAALLYGKNVEILSEFIRFGAELNSGYENSLFFALKNLAEVRFLVGRGADVNYANALGETPIFKAVKLNDLELVKFLTQSGADVNKKTIDLNSKSAYVSGFGGEIPKFVKLCDFEATSRSVLMQAARFSNVEILEFLIDSGADASATDDEGLNALDHAAISHNDINAQYLRSLGLKPNLIKE